MPHGSTQKELYPRADNTPPSLTISSTANRSRTSRAGRIQTARRKGRRLGDSDGDIRFKPKANQEYHARTRAATRTTRRLGAEARPSVHIEPSQNWPRAHRKPGKPETVRIGESPEIE